MDSLWTIVSEAWRACDRREQLLVVTLHRIDHSEGRPRQLVEKSLRALRDKYRFVLPHELCELAISGKMAMLTVDDGYREVYTTLYPMLRAMNMPMVLCVPTDFFLRKCWLWTDTLRWLMEKNGETRLGIPSGASGAVSLKSLKQYLKTLGPAKRQVVIAEIAKHGEVYLPPEPEEAYGPITLSEMREMLKSGLVELASHTISHSILTTLSDEELAWELLQSKHELESFSGQPVRAFCYPNGLTGDFDQRTRAAIMKAGYMMAFTSVHGINYKRTVDWFELRRIHIHRRESVFRKSISGLDAFLTSLKRGAEKHE